MVKEAVAFLEAVTLALATDPVTGLGKIFKPAMGRDERSIVIT